MHVGRLNLQRMAMNRLQLMRAKATNNILKTFGYNPLRKYMAFIGVIRAYKLFEMANFRE
jgi:hypothetical protein